MITAFWRDVNSHPIMTTIDTIPIDQIPFPQITVDLGPVSNPWGYIEKVYNHLEFVETDDPFGKKPLSKLRYTKTVTFKIKSMFHISLGLIFYILRMY